MENGSDRSTGATLALAWTVDDDAATATVSLRGELDTETAGEFEHVIDRLLATDVRHVVVDLAELDFLDSSGLRVLIWAKHLLHDERGGSLELRHSPSFALRLLEVTGLDTFFAVR